MANKEVGNRVLDWYKEINKLTLIGALGFAAVAAFVAPALVNPALTIAAIDAGQMVFINSVNKKPKTA